MTDDRTEQSAQCIGKRIRWRKKEVNAGDKRCISVDESQLPPGMGKVHTYFFFACFAESVLDNTWL